MMNLDALEAKEDLRFIYALGSAFGGESGRDYIEHLSNKAWWDDPERVNKQGEMMDITDNRHGNPNPES